MTTFLDDPASIDGAGTKRWTYHVDGGLVLHVFERQRDYLSKGEARFRLRLSTWTGTVVGNSWETTKVKAAQLARWIERDAREGATDEAYHIIIRAIHEHGIRQALALDALVRRGLYLSLEQRQQAQVAG